MTREPRTSGKESEPAGLMAGRRTGSNPGITLLTQTIAIAEQLRQECSELLRLYAQKESFASGVADRRLVSVPHPSTQPDPGDKLWSLHKALLLCQGLMKRAVDREEKELGGKKKGDYEERRREVKGRLDLLVSSSSQILKAVKGAVPSVKEPESDSFTVFELKVWVYRVFREVDHWAKVAIDTLKSDGHVVTCTITSNGNRCR